MVIEASRLKGVPVVAASGEKLGTVDRLVFSADQARLIGFQISRTGLIKKFGRLDLDAVVDLSSEGVVAHDSSSVGVDLAEFDQVSKTSGPLIGVTAKTTTGTRLGHVTDVVIETQTGGIVRLYLRNLLTERIIPLQFLVSIGPKEIIFQDDVNKPTFDQLASNPEVAQA